MLETAQRFPERAAIVGGGRRLSYRELVEDSRRVSAAVASLHAGQTAPPVPAPETDGIPITAISAESAFAAARLVAGLAGYRAVSAVIDPRWPLAHRVRAVLATGIGVLISEDRELSRALAEAGWGGRLVGLEEFEQRVASAAPAAAPEVRPGDEAFLMLFSSGTTSAPKAFLKTREQYRRKVAVSSAHLEPLPGVATLAPGPVSYSLTLYAVIECLATGGEVHLADAFDPFSLGPRIAEEGITRVVAVPAVVEAIAIAARRDPESFRGLELVVTGGANLPAAIRSSLAKALPETRLISYYGAAEIGFIGDSRDGDGTGIAIYPGIGAEIRDERGVPVPEGELGELWINAAARSDGYLAGTSDETLLDERGWATVHDLGRMRNGRLELVGRSGDVVATGGHKVSLPEVERAFEGMPGAGAVVAVALPDPVLGSLIALVAEPEGVAPPGRDALAAWARAKLPPQFVPKRWYRVDELPRTVGGKLRRGAAAELVANGEAVRL